MDVARMSCGLSIPELPALAGMEPATGSKAIQCMRSCLPGDRKLKSILRKVSAEIGARVTCYISMPRYDPNPSPNDKTDARFIARQLVSGILPEGYIYLEEARV